MPKKNGSWIWSTLGILLLCGAYLLCAKMAPDDSPRHEEPSSESLFKI